ncbi:MAG TPA: class I SAM-dependent methyltransferase [Candidatus Saccharimonadales bacterium]|nr:class I SAM-dependent methyltransferase [Candidatus Saccharimonadales bacterium]
MKSIRDKAINVLQYDSEEIKFTQGAAVRRMFAENLLPKLKNVDGKKILDVGFGEGWLCGELAKLGTDVVGIDPSIKNIKYVEAKYSDIKFYRSSLQEFKTTEHFDFVIATMVLEHISDLENAFLKLKSLLKRGGKILIVTGDFDLFTRQRRDYKVETEIIGPGEVAARTDYGEGLGVIYDIIRKPDITIKRAKSAGLTLVSHIPVITPEWFIEEDSYNIRHKDKPIFQLFVFS